MNSKFKEEAVIMNDPEFISPKIDYAFKQMMNNKIALKILLSAVLKYRKMISMMYSILIPIFLKSIRMTNIL